MTNVTVQEIKQRLDAGEDVHLLDVREPDERAEFNIGGAFIPLGNILTMQTDDIAEWQNEEVIVYCRSGRRSVQAALTLESLGFTNVKNLEGGVLAWQAI
ncbi:rhodanese-like domain-containing protein [Ferruginibacter sp. HRS2-29]|uniref:rhodanese-like domain-containing protein n=1 Tax=Ferruginibacter sp. HRS2-29 TaxID=2487334 RepID=UPI0020CBD01C|nr:rhodanese-like domain-containing protein [Ferruginibacter sp. HRS2-29]MCP9749508.1 rhodanese-like domain-containing protein [Ferruginibacter sp. HRS2-29]